MNRLIISFPPTPKQTNVFWLGARPDMIDKRHAMDFLIGINRFTGAFEPQLATEWTMAPDGMSWNFKLRPGIQFHDGWGEFTSQDVVHSTWTITQPTSIQSDNRAWRTLVDSGDAIQSHFNVADDHDITFLINNPTVDFDSQVSYMRELVMQSKDFWDAEGLDGYIRTIVGTGPYELRERNPTQGFVLYERVENHWRHTPDFPEMIIIHTLEDATRMAQLLTEEAHIAPLSADIQGEAQKRGMEVIKSTQPGQQASFLIGGLYFEQPGNFDPNDKLTDIRVRKAMNLAVDRDEIIDSLFLGRAEKLIVQGWHRDLLPGYDPQWDADFDEAYGFNPDLASQLVREAGAEGFEFEILQYPRPGMPEWVDIAEALALYWEAVGLSPKLRQVDQAFISAPLREYSLHGFLWPNNTGLITQPLMIWFWNYSPEAGGRQFQDAGIDVLYPQMAQSVDLAERERLSREIGTILFDSYPNIPLVWVFSEMVINPNIVDEYAFPGIISGLYTHFEYVRAAR